MSLILSPGKEYEIGGSRLTRDHNRANRVGSCATAQSQSLFVLWNQEPTIQRITRWGFCFTVTSLSVVLSFLSFILIRSCHEFPPALYAITLEQCISHATNSFDQLTILPISTYFYLFVSRYNPLADQFTAPAALRQSWLPRQSNYLTSPRIIQSPSRPSPPSRKLLRSNWSINCWRLF